MKNVFAVIMAGGGGERFWPASRQTHPKQLLKLFGGRSMIQETVSRLSPIVPKERVIVITTSQQAVPVRKQLPEIPRSSIISEPFGRDTAACIAMAAAIVAKRDANGIMIALPADHVIRDRGRFISTLKDACRMAIERECLVTLGIKPREPATGYGYIHVGKRIKSPLETQFSNAVEFTEKPDLATAWRYVRSGNYLWNSGIFVWRAGVIADEFRKHMPALYRGYERMRGAAGGRAMERVVKDVYAGLKKVSIDYGIMEKSKRVVVARAEFDWDDVGSWIALERHRRRDRSGNVILGECIALETERCIIVSDGGVIGCHGVKDLVIVKTPDVVLVCHRRSAQKIKEIIKELKSNPGGERYI